MSLISICDVDLRPLRSTGHSFLDPAKLQRTPNYAGAAKRRRLMRAFAIRQASGSLQHTFPIIVAKQNLADPKADEGRQRTSLPRLVPQPIPHSQFAIFPVIPPSPDEANGGIASTHRQTRLSDLC
ncbi:hypothetical protein QA649_37025 [Bradyrhizobium sp. CB1717]|uniref:hypothetical protein n=1 Tax=Bradyrhizobium sp. CB1717 TaxID=3039154 RepID=UPI0024B1DEEE|nr:hypothetical protein [Bradyrhizobium sp. CB1717]WFU23565.1 hypothetical protein QA649_37025 [Bradyrhizobium sp. CB1717]